MLGLCCCAQTFSSCKRELLSSCSAWASNYTGFFCCGTWALGAQQLWPTGLVASQQVETSWTRDPTHVSCIGMWILNHWATREVPESALLIVTYSWLSPSLLFFFLVQSDSLMFLFVCLPGQRRGTCCAACKISVSSTNQGG